jgi:DNA segregation ATPase FtsK/SpoIIIE, S-DNA-T family
MKRANDRKDNDIFSTKPITQKEKEVNEAIGQFINDAVLTIGIGGSHYCKLLFRRPIRTILATGLSVAVFYYLTFEGVLYYFIPESLGVRVFDWFFLKIEGFSWETHFTILFTPYALGVLTILGMILMSTRKKFENIFLNVGIKNHQGGTPKLVSMRKLGKYRKEYLFDLNYTSLKRFKEKEDELEVAFLACIESLQPAKRKNQICMTTTLHGIDERLTFSELQKMKPLKNEHFYLGMSLTGVEIEKIEDLPHMLIGGTTNSGKSVFFKQILAGLLQSSKHIQMYLIDLKNGLEFSDFKEAPNVLVYKEASQALKVLESVKVEMKKRFEYMEEKNIRKITPGVDPFDRIIVAIDEASVIYFTKKTDQELAIKLKARDITDDLAKLARAAAINLIFATQKVAKEVIPTNIQENISARMAFKANTMHGSTILIDTKEALDLPSTKGRGIWRFGAIKKEIQGPYISGREIRKICIEIQQDFKEKRKFLYQDLLGVQGLKSKKSRLNKMTDKFNRGERDEI